MLVDMSDCNKHQACLCGLEKFNKIAPKKKTKNHIIQNIGSFVEHLKLQSRILVGSWFTGNY